MESDQNIICEAAAAARGENNTPDPPAALHSIFQINKPGWGKISVLYPFIGFDFTGLSSVQCWVVLHVPNRFLFNYNLLYDRSCYFPRRPVDTMSC